MSSKAQGKGLVLARSITPITNRQDKGEALRSEGTGMPSIKIRSQFSSIPLLKIA